MFWSLLVDVIWNGSFVDWFVRSYMIEDQYTLPDGTWVERTHRLDRIEIFLLWTVIITIIVVITIVIVVAHFMQKESKQNYNQH